MQKNTIPTYLEGTEVFRVKPGTYYDVHYKHRIDEIGNGNIDAFHMRIYSMLEAWMPEFEAGNLVDVTDDPTQVVDFGEVEGEAQAEPEPQTPEIATFVADEQVVFAPPVEDSKPKPKRNAGRPKGAKNKKKHKEVSK